ncbi:MAG: HD domain-containing protein [Nitrospirae bacterium]|nr:HD domain-containing protein [Nitrospirota bacterium]
MEQQPSIKLADLIFCLSDAMDFIDPSVVNHHKQVAYIASSLGAEMGLSEAKQKELLLAGALHDIGAFSLKARKDTLKFQFENALEHAEAGYSLLRLFEPLSGIVSTVRFHHVPWDKGKGGISKRQKVPLSAHIVNLADRVAVLINKKKEVLGQITAITRKINENSGSLFMPEVVDCFNALASREYFWLDTVSPSIQSILTQKLKGASFETDSDDMMGFSRLFSRIIDFKSPYTATHSSGVAASSEMLSRFIGFPEKDSRIMRIAGYLHDLGKLAVPVEILNKPAKLNSREYNVIRHHSFYTYRILETIPAFSTINKWAAFHHEQLNGLGYPFHLKEKALPQGSQIMAVADVFTAVTENRPYRPGMTMGNAMHILDKMADSRAINKDVVEVLRKNFDEIDSARAHAQASAMREYKYLSQNMRDFRA